MGQHLLDESQCGLPPARKTAVHPRGRASLEPMSLEEDPLEDPINSKY